MPSCGHSSMATARTVSNSDGVFAGMTGRRHPVGRQLDVADAGDARRRDVGQRLADRHASRGRPVDQRERACARPSRTLRRDTSVNPISVTATSATGTCHGPDHLVARSTDRRPCGRRSRSGKSCSPRPASAARAAPLRPDRLPAKSSGGSCAPAARDVARHFRRLAEQHLEIHVDRIVAEMRIVDHEPAVGCRACRPPQWDSARARTDRFEVGESLPAQSPCT